jgi:hypothetical protein
MGFGISGQGVPAKFLQVNNSVHAVLSKGDLVPHRLELGFAG